MLSFVFMLLLISLGAKDSAADETFLELNRKWVGDFDKMMERRVIRALVPFSKTFYFLDGPRPRGLTYEGLMEFETYINQELKTKHLKVHVVIIPTTRERLLPDLIAGRGDIAAGNLTITPERMKEVDFTDPFFNKVDEIIVTGPSSPSIKKLDDLAGKEIFARPSSSYYQSLRHLNRAFKEAGKKPMQIIRADEYLEDEDLLEMMNAGILPMIPIDSHKGAFWIQIFEKLTLHQNIKLRTGGRIAWAVRKDSPKLKSVVNGFIKTHKIGTLMGNILFKRYLENTKWVRNAISDEELWRFSETSDLFKKYSSRYQFDWLMMMALAYQESGLDQRKRNSSGALGIMQILPGTASDPNVNIQDIHKTENNIHAGTKYLRFIANRYYKNEPMDKLNKTLFAIASYNAGPAKIARMRKEAVEMGLDPNIWFQNVEVVSAKRIGRENVQYVSNIYKYYLSYKLINSIDNLKDMKQ
jgi:membrane-bound lytic murein transglycosylase MltF